MPDVSAAINRRAFLTGMRHPARRVPQDISNSARAIAFISDDCLARAGIVCMSCRDACSEQAIGLQPRRGGPFLPQVVDTACTGCSSCIALCPAHAITLTHREPNADV